MQRKQLSKAKLIVIKIGSSTLTDKNGKLDLGNLARLVTEISALKKQGRQVVIVTSGAIVTGAEKLMVLGKLKSMAEKQAAAAVGQIILMRDYEKFFAKSGLTIAQVLLTRDAIADRIRYLNSRNTLNTLLKMGVIPIINENDTVAVDEIKVGDNDNLSALVASLIGADLLIMLTDVKGFYNKSKLQSYVCEIDQEIEAAAQHTRTAFGTGGMFTKIEAAKTALLSGIPVIICHGRQKNIFKAILAGKEIGTLFDTKCSKTGSRKRWVAHGLRPAGGVIIDDGAERALTQKGSSLLPVGVKEIVGKFKINDNISILDSAQKEIGRGIANYSSDDLTKIKGKKTAEIKSLLGPKSRDEVVHRDNLILL